MAKRKITVTVDESLVDQVQALGAASLSSVVNEALEREVDRRARNAALRRLLAEWDDSYGPLSPDELAAARADFDDLDAVSDGSGEGQPDRGAA